MLKRTVCMLVTVVLLALAPMLAGCGDEAKIQQHREVHDMVIHQDTVVQ